MDSFKKAYKSLNKQQKKAVDLIHGPLLVIAGPGTGKTQLLALRAAQILQLDETLLPGNILCLTFTDNAADNMRGRLVRYIGQDAYRVAIHTFNSFGQYIMNAHPEYFYEWREMQTADELTTHRILEEILDSLPGSHVLAPRGDDGIFYSLRQIKNLISDAKTNNILPAELKGIILKNNKDYEELIPVIRRSWPSAMTQKDALAAAREVASTMASIKPTEMGMEAVTSEKDLIIEDLLRADAESREVKSGQTRPFTAWKERWLAKDGSNEWIFKSQQHSEKLHAAADIYERYQSALQARGLVDFDDQIMWVLRTLETKDELRYDLQERFQYVMIDEFQDTNRAQLMMAQYITDAPVHEGKPNLMVVGDDDQAIFRFQGADIGNVEGFEARYGTTEPIMLVDNYRSNQDILDASRRISRQIRISLESQKEINKELVATVELTGAGVRLNEFDSDASHYSWHAQQVKKLLNKGVDGNEIAVLARERRQLDSLVPYLRALNIPIDYERSENVLEQQHVITLLQLARLVSCLGAQQLEEANTLLPTVLGEPMWGIPAVDIWQVASQAYKQKVYWLDIMLRQKGTRLRQAADFLMSVAAISPSYPAELVLDRLVGISGDEDEKFVSPFKEYFFGDELLKNQPAEYLTLLSHLSTLRSHLRKYQANQKTVLTIGDLLDFVDAYRRTDLQMLDKSPHREKDNAVRLMTVHKAKGLEFDNVFIIGLENSVWTKSGRPNRFSYPQNLLAIKPTDNDDDDSLRLLFVAMTRARHSLHMGYFLQNEDAKAEQPYGPLLSLEIEAKKPKVSISTPALADQYEKRWLKKHGSVKHADMRSYLSEDLARYKLSASHLNDFLNIPLGGPRYFLTQRLLHFPSAKSPYAAYGSAMHAAMSAAHDQISTGKKLNIERIVARFKEILDTQALGPKEHERFEKEGPETLTYYLEKESASFKPEQRVDISFADQTVVLGEARLRGDIDRMDFDQEAKTIVISDYKTGSPVSRWQLPSSAAQRERIKMHHYRNQLMFYKLLVDGSADFGKKGWRADSGMLRFLKRNPSGRLVSLPLEYDQEEMEAFKRLVSAVWHRVQKLDFPDTSEYEPTLEGILKFEADLIEKTDRA